MKATMCALVGLTLFVRGTLWNNGVVEACVTPRLGDISCSCVSSTVGREGCTTDGRTCLAWGNCQCTIILPK
jgi:hypothetical protein